MPSGIVEKRWGGRQGLLHEVMELEIKLKLTGLDRFLDGQGKELKHFLINHEFEVEEEVYCEYCGESQFVTIPVWLSKVESGWAYGPGGSTMVECIACGRDFEIIWEEVAVELPSIL